MVATFNGWDDMPEEQREALERWEEEQGSNALTIPVSPRISSFIRHISE